MINIIFVLLIVVTQPADYYGTVLGHYVWENGVGVEDKEIIDEWSTNIQRGDSSTPGKSHYKAILFSTDAALDRYLKKYETRHAVLIDIKAGKVYEISQKAIEKTITEEKQVIDHYEWEKK